MAEHRHEAALKYYDTYVPFLLEACNDESSDVCQVQIQGSIPHHDNLREMELELLKRHHRPVSKDVNGFSSSMDSFTIKLVVMHGLISYFFSSLFPFPPSCSFAYIMVFIPCI